MGWEQRGGGLYYYRSRRVNGRVVKEYVGASLVAELQAIVDEANRGSERTRMEAVKAEHERLEELDAELDAACGVIGLIARAALVAAGYRQHKRGEWRLKRGR
jgi:hypothetical protein